MEHDEPTLTPDKQASACGRGRRLVLVVATLCGSWLGMSAIHELGHVLHAWLSGATVAGVDLPLVGFSQTHVSPNPHPRFVAWGGALWGSLLPLFCWAAVRRWAPALGFLAAFFAGFCCVANGAYLAAGSFVGGANDADDAHELLRRGAQTWQLIAFGLVAAAVGVSLWHGLGSSFGLGKTPAAIESRAVAAAVLLLCGWIAAFWVAAVISPPARRVGIAHQNAPVARSRTRHERFPFETLIGTRIGARIGEPNCRVRQCCDTSAGSARPTELRIFLE